MRRVAEILRCFAPLAGGAAVVVALGGGCVELGPVGVSMLEVALSVAVSKELGIFEPDAEAEDMAVVSVELAAAVALDALLEAELETEAAIEDA